MGEKTTPYELAVPNSVSIDALRRMVQNDHFIDTVMKCWEIYDHKGADYTRGKGDLDRTDNFKMAAENNGVTPLQAWGVYFYKHVSAVWRFLKDGKVESEPIEGRIHDVINYSILLLILVKEMRGNQSQK
jgi:hypothetical protein